MVFQLNKRHITRHMSIFRCIDRRFETGKADFQAVIFCFGDGRNGKSTFIEILRRIHLFDGGSQAPTSSSLTLAGTGTNLQYGWAIEALGDIEGDGYDDFAISSAGGLLDLTGYGKVEIHSGSSTGHSTTPSATWMQNVLQGTLLGYSVESLGDVNGDGYNDLGFGEPYVDTAGPGSNGAIHIAFGGANGFPSAFNQSIQGPSPGSKMGFQMSAAGDVDRDGYDDVWAVRPGSGATGDLALYWGSSSGLSSNPRVFSYSDVIDVVRSDDFDDDSQEEWLVIDEMKISVYEHLDWEQVSIEGPFAGESNFSELDLYIDGPGRSIIGVQTDSIPKACPAPYTTYSRSPNASAISTISLLSIA